MMDFLSRVEAWKKATLDPERTTEFLKAEGQKDTDQEEGKKDGL